MSNLLMLLNDSEGLIEKIKALFGSSIVTFYRMNEVNGTDMIDIVGRHNGSYNGPTLSAINSIQVNEKAPLFDGTGDDCNIYVGCSAMTPSVAGTVLGWCKIAPAEWLDGSARDVISIYALSGDNIILKKQADTNALGVFFVYGAANKSFAFTFTSPDWFSFCFTWNKAQDKFNFYINGYQAYAEQTGLGIWVEGLYTDYCRIGGFGGGIEPHKGSVSNLVFLNRMITADEAMRFTTTASYLPSMSIIGDSIEATWGTWVYTVAKQYKGYVLKNHAVAGTAIVAHMAEQAAATFGDKSNIVIMGLGTNDDNAGNMTTLQAVVEAGIDTVKANNPGCTIYYMNVLPRWTNNTTGPEVEKGNIRTAIAAACIAKSVTCWDTYSTPWILQSDTDDGVHPSAATGYPKIVAEVLSRLP